MRCVSDAWAKHEAELRRFLRHRAHSDAEARISCRKSSCGPCASRTACAASTTPAPGSSPPRAICSSTACACPRIRCRYPKISPPRSKMRRHRGRPRQCLPRVLVELSPQDREAITLCDLEGMTQQDYAARLGLQSAGRQVARAARACPAQGAHDRRLSGPFRRDRQCRRLRATCAALSRSGRLVIAEMVRLHLFEAASSSQVPLCPYEACNREHQSPRHRLRQLQDHLQADRGSRRSEGRRGADREGRGPAGHHGLRRDEHAGRGHRRQGGARGRHSRAATRSRAGWHE